jgi:hypothetical protein
MRPATFLPSLALASHPTGKFCQLKTAVRKTPVRTVVAIAMNLVGMVNTMLSLLNSRPSP